MSEQGEAPQGAKIEFTIQNIPFEAAAPYAEGHVMSKQEAAVLNQTRVENLRNNFAGVIKKKIEAIAKEEPPRTELSEDEIAALKEEFASYEDSYEFQGKRTSRAPVDPVKREAVRMAKDTITTALRGKGIDPKNLVEGKMEELISGYLEKNPQVLEEAKARVEAAKALANDALDGITLEGIEKEPEPAPAA